MMGYSSIYRSIMFYMGYIFFFRSMMNRISIWDGVLYSMMEVDCFHMHKIVDIERYICELGGLSLRIWELVLRHQGEVARFKVFQTGSRNSFHGYDDVFFPCAMVLVHVFVRRTGVHVYFSITVATRKFVFSEFPQAFRRKGKLYLVFEFVEKSMLDILEVRRP